MDKYTVVKTRVANLYRKASFKSELITQALNKEKLLILKKSDNWYKVRQWDGYESWIHNFYIYEERYIDNFLFNDFKVYDFSVNKFIKYAKSFLNVPYLWGGKSSLGFDCSGLVQTIFKNFGIYLPRDSHEQIKYRGLFEIDYSDTEEGDLLFFSDKKVINHVAICIGNEEIIHSSGYVKIEKIRENRELYKKIYKIMSIRNIINE